LAASFSAVGGPVRTTTVDSRGVPHVGMRPHLLVLLTAGSVILKRTLRAFGFIPHTCGEQSTRSRYSVGLNPREHPGDAPRRFVRS
jgi:hypothetical protein